MMNKNEVFDAKTVFRTAHEAFKCKGTPRNVKQGMSINSYPYYSLRP